ncbi:MAG: hypothetical protein IKF14_02930 [Atopobiaceae bacterium]|nr:hypothetical protein [Atopobiaceae bacterium]
MFLNQLNANEKLAFIALAEKAAEANGLIEDEEKRMIEAFRLEMNVGPDASLPFDDITALDVVAKGSERSRRIVFLELLALLKSGEDFDDEEREHAARLQTALGLDDETAQRINLQLGDYEYVYASLCETILV